MITCPEKWCRSTDIAQNPPSHTPGFHPDYGCNKCGFRWIDRAEASRQFRVKPRLTELHDAVKDFRLRVGGVDAEFNFGEGRASNGGGRSS